MTFRLKFEDAKGKFHWRSTIVESEERAMFMGEIYAQRNYCKGWVLKQIVGDENGISRVS